eukprot:6172719-Pleurochrysis_carterae.AAC.8
MLPLASTASMGMSHTTVAACHPLPRRLQWWDAPSVNYEGYAFVASATSVGARESLGAAREQGTQGERGSAGNGHAANGWPRCAGSGRRSRVWALLCAEPAGIVVIEANILDLSCKPRTRRWHRATVDRAHTVRTRLGEQSEARLRRCLRHVRLP